MRVAELFLERYGRFADYRMSFPKADRDFHLVYGPNEAGKTTTLAALTDLLFGFGQRAAYDYRFKAPMLRVGAVLERGAERLACRRRRGKAGTLVDADDSPIDEGPLLAMLHGLQRESFLLSSSLDHARLRQGGSAMAESKDDLGQMLFAAGSGVTNLRAVIAALDEELDEIWAKRAADKRSFTRAERAWTAARGALKDASVKPTEWTRARDAVDHLRDRHTAAERERREAAAALVEAERLRRVHAPLARLRALTEALAENAAPTVPEAVDLVARQALVAAADATRMRDAAMVLLKDDLAKLESEPDQLATLVLADRIDALIQGVKAETDRREQLPSREERLRSHRAAAATAAAKLNIEISDALTAPVPDVADLARLTALAKRRVELQALADAARAKMETTTAEVAAADAALSSVRLPEGLDRLRTAIDAAKREGDLDAAVGLKRTALVRAGERQDDLIATLAPWSGDVLALARLAPPADDTIDAAREGWASADRSLTDAKRALTERTEAMELAEARVQSLINGEGVVPLERLQEARNARDDTLGRLRGHLAGERPLAHPFTEVERLSDEVGVADDLADRRFNAADAAARLSEAQTASYETALKRRQSEQRLEEAHTRADEVRSAWRTVLERASLPSLSPEELRNWLRRRADALDAHNARANAEDAHEAAKQARRAALMALAEAVGEPEPAPDSALRPALSRAEAQLTNLDAAARAYIELKGEAKNAAKQRDEARRALLQSEQDLKGWSVQWEAETATINLTLAPDVAEARLPIFETLRGALEQARDYRHRVEAMKSDTDRFAADATAVAKALGIVASEPLDVVSVAKARLEAARKTATRRLTLEESVHARRDEIRVAEAALQAADATLADAFALTCAIDRPALATALDAAGRRREIENDFARLRRELLELADGVPLEKLEAACANLTADALAAHSREVRDRTEAATQAWEELARQLAEASSALRRLDTDGAAAAAASDVEAARSEMESIAETYLLKRTQRVLLDHAVKRQAERGRNPLLGRAGALFRTLTLERYADLRVDQEAERKRLIGVGADGATVVQVADMSEGTQDQLFLALRLAAIERATAGGARPPFFADDLFVTFDDDRARAGLQVLGELSRTTQVLFFTHHAHLLRLAHEVFPELSVHDLHEVP
jgi:uncharacterized protein YhaN